MSERFPGMNPYLEDSFFWQRFRTSYIVHLSDALNAILPAGYVAAAEQRLAILPDDQTRIADMALIETAPTSQKRTKSATAVLERGAPDGTVAAMTTDVYERYIEIRTGGRMDVRVVTVIELLSPSNKARGSSGRREYLLKQQELIRTDTHLMEIDLLRFGAHTVAAPLDRLPDKSTWDYIVSSHRWTNRFHFDFWLNRLTERLPEVRVPLLPGDPDLVVDLQAVFNLVYRSGRYGDQIDLTAPIPQGATD